MNKYGARKTYSALCKRTFDSIREASYADELWLRQYAGDIGELEFQVPFVLSKKPSVKVIVDFKYWDAEGNIIFEDVKGFMQPTSRIKFAWLKQLFGIEVQIVR